MNYLLDTNILLIYTRENSLKDIIEENYNPFGVSNNTLISVVTVGEIKAIALKNNWGNRRINLLESILNRLIIVDINSEDVIERYAELDTYSQNKLEGRPLGASARNMGKNDLWIAATASVINAKLITTDNDFNHLDNVYLDLIKVAP